MRNRGILAIAILLIILASMGGYIYLLNTRITFLEEKIVLLENQTLLPVTGPWEKGFSQLKEELNTLQGTLTQIQDNLTLLQDRLDDLSGDMEGMENKLEDVIEATSQGLGVSTLYEMVKDSVVSIRVIFRDVFFKAKSEGSGFVYDSSGIIITNNHVVDGAFTIDVVFIDGTSVKASVIGSDPYSDLAVLMLLESLEGLKPLPLGDSSSLKVGDPIVAIGNPFGLSGSLTTGVVSQVGRTLPAVGGYLIPNVIQIDAAVNPGNSGGPLLNLKGEVVGMTTAIRSTTGAFSGVGFAIPSNTIKREIPSLIEKGSYDHPWLGVKGVAMSSEIAELMGVDVTRGWLITDVVEGGPAEEAGLRGGEEQARIGELIIPLGGDIILKIDDVPIRTGDDLSSYLEEKTRPGQTVILTILREGEVKEVPLTLGVRPPPT